MIEEDKDAEYIDYEATFNEVIEVERSVVEAEEVAEGDGEEETSDGELPPGKDFNQVTGYEGRWYYIPTGELTYELYRLSNKGKTSGSRVMYINEQGGKLFMHKPHPDSTLKSYQIDDLIDALKKEGLL